MKEFKAIIDGFVDLMSRTWTPNTLTYLLTDLDIVLIPVHGDKDCLNYKISSTREGEELHAHVHIDLGLAITLEKSDEEIDDYVCKEVLKWVHAMDIERQRKIEGADFKFRDCIPRNLPV